MQPDPAGKKLGPLWLTPGIGYGNAAAGIYASFTTIGLLIYLSFVQPYLLTEVLNIPQGDQGSITGRLASLTEVVQIIAMSTIGAMSDQLGRRVIFVLGFVFLGIGYFLYPPADSVLQLTIFRLIFAVGAASIPTMLTAIVIDYSQPISRGKWFGVSTFCGGLALAYGCAFVGRGDLVIIGTFLPLWATQMGLEAGMSTGEALAKGMGVLSVNQTVILVFAFGAGYLTDKFNKIAVLAVSFAMAALGYFGMWFIADPFNTLIFAAIIPLAIGEVTITVACSALVGQEAPVQSRGSILGVFGVIGAIGIAVATFVGGEIFDSIGKTAPFAMMACFNLVIVTWALYVYLTQD